MVEYKKTVKFDILKEVGYVLLLITFFVGIMIGSFSLKNIPDMVLESYKLDLESAIGNTELRNKSNILFNNLKMILFFWFAGMSVVGIPLLIVFIGYKGFSLGYTISVISKIFEISIANKYIFKTLFLNNMMVVFIMISMTNFAIKILKNFIDNKENIKVDAIKYTIFSAITCGIYIFLNLLFL